MKEYNLASDGTTPSFTNLASTKFENALEAAREYHGRGFIVTPLSGKTPILQGWQKRKLSEEELPHYFGDGQNIGIVLGGAYGLSDVDLDNSLAVVAADCLLPNSVKSGREKNPYSHRWFCCDPVPTSKTYSLTKTMAEQLELGDGGTTLVELRSDGRQTTVASSIHPEDGDQYVWHSGEILKVDGNELEELVREVAISTLLALHWPEGSRQSFSQCAAGYLGRHMKHERVQVILEAAVTAAKDEEHPKRCQAVRDTLRKLLEGQEAVTGGPTLEELAPGVAGLIARWCGWRLTEEGKKGGKRKNAGTVGGDEKDEMPTHDELCDAWLETRKDPTAFGQSEWRRYGAGFWAPVHEQIVNREIDEILIEAKPEGINPTSGMRGSVEKLAQAKAFVPDEVWDANEDILACANGTLEISSATLREHRPEDYSLSALPYEFDPEASAPSWHRFLASTVPDAAGFLQEFAGYALTGDTSHELAVWLYGPPGGGKSTFIEGHRAVFGARAGLLGLAEIQRSRFALADLPGKTLLVATEQPSDFIKSTDILNAIISGEEVKAEQKFRRAFTVIPRAKICWAMNELPRVKDNNNGLFRRVKVVPFPKLRVKKDRELKEKIKEDGAGILVWALEGLKRLHERGYFEIPECVREATEQFRQTSDVPGIFVEEACITSDAEGCEEQAMELYKAYKHWCRTHGHSPMGYVSAAAEWRRLGFGERSLHGRKFYTGVKVDPSWIKAQEDYPRS